MYLDAIKYKRMMCVEVYNADDKEYQYCYITYDEKRGLLRCFDVEINVDYSRTLDDNLSCLYDTILEEHPEFIV